VRGRLGAKSKSGWMGCGRRCAGCTCSRWRSSSVVSSCSPSPWSRSSVPPPMGPAPRHRSPLRLGTLLAIAVLLATGSAMASHFDLWGDGTLHIKLALVALVAVLVVWHMRRPAVHALEAAIFVVSLLIAWLRLALVQGRPR
jgi:hypothetical protein